MTIPGNLIFTSWTAEKLALLSSELKEILLSESLLRSPLAYSASELIIKATLKALRENNPARFESSLLEIARNASSLPPEEAAFDICLNLKPLKYRMLDLADPPFDLATSQSFLSAFDDLLLGVGKSFRRAGRNAPSGDAPPSLPDTTKSQERLNALLVTLFSAFNDILILILNNDGRIANVSHSVKRFFEFEPEEILHRPIDAIRKFESENDEDWGQILSKVNQDGAWTGDLSFTHREKSEARMRFSFTKIRSKHGNELGIMAVGRDVSEQRQLQEQLLKYAHDLQQILEERSRDLEESEERYRHLIEEINEGYFIARHGKLVFTNNAFARITGFSRQELDGAEFLNLVVKRDDRTALSWWRSVQDGSSTNPVEFMVQRRDGRKAVVECKAQPLILRDEQHVIGVLRDITEKKKMERQLKRYVYDLEKMVAERTEGLERSLSEQKSLQSQLVQSEKLAGIGILAAGVAHEINNPLQALILKSQHILKHIDDSMEVKRSTRDIIGYANRMAEIVRGLSKYSRTVRSEDITMAVDLAEIIKESLELSYHTRNFGDIIVKREFDLVGPVRGNKGQYQQIFINLIVNAIDAMEGKGKLTLRLRTQDPTTVLAEVSDSGCGIPVENLDKIFNPFFTTKPTGKGTGMGLHVAYRIITQYGGDIKIKSEEGKGTTFLLNFPRVEEPAPSPLPVTPPTPASR